MNDDSDDDDSDARCCTNKISKEHRLIQNKRIQSLHLFSDGELGHRGVNGLQLGYHNVLVDSPVCL